MRIDFRRLNYFVAVVDNDGFNKAASALHITQPAISLAIKELEEDFGESLFDRSQQGPLLTAQGRSLYNKVKPLIEQLTQIDRNFFKRKFSENTLTIGHFGPGPLEFLKTLIECLERDFPETRIVFEPRRESALIPSLLRGEFDFAILPDEFKNEDFKTKLIGSHELFLLTHQSHRLAERACASHQDLKNETILIPSQKAYPYLHQRSRQIIAELGADFNVLNDSENLAELAFHTVLSKKTAILPSPLLRLGVPEAVHLKLSGVNTVLDVRVAWRSDRLNKTGRIFENLLFSNPLDLKQRFLSLQASSNVKK